MSVLNVSGSAHTACCVQICERACTVYLPAAHTHSKHEGGWGPRWPTRLLYGPVSCLRRTCVRLNTGPTEASCSWPIYNPSPLYYQSIWDASLFFCIVTSQSSTFNNLKAAITIHQFVLWKEDSFCAFSWRWVRWHLLSWYHYCPLFRSIFLELCTLTTKVFDPLVFLMCSTCACNHNWLSFLDTDHLNQSWTWLLKSTNEWKDPSTI